MKGSKPVLAELKLNDYKEMGKTTDNSESKKAYDELLKQYEKKDYNNVLSKWKDATTHDLGFTAPVILKGQIQTNEKQYADAIESYKTVLSVDKNNHLSYFGLGNVYSEKGDYEN